MKSEAWVPEHTPPESPPRGESSESPGRKELPGREELPQRKEATGKKVLPGRKVVPERDEVMSEEWSSEEQESIDQSSSDGSYTNDSRLVKARFWEKRMDDLEKLRTPEQIQKLNSSTVGRAAVKILGEYEEKPDETMASQTEYMSVRDYLLTSICINNGSRSGALANMTIGEFRSAQALDGSFVVKVKKHKTFTTHGPANIVLSTMLHNWMKIFINKFCYALADNTSENDESVFLTWSNRPMDSSQIGCQIDSAWGKVFGKYAATGGGMESGENLTEWMETQFFSGEHWG
ncbi:Neurofilament medium polypeptide [Paramuricea clavata]|uniref:Neurofilament medium polypeptide n=1 Tax=Paramuricea clavata TaxID=317549 RepID=A0A6S7HTE0_PARCT|nr:Neurofilament medium polypeptide [Paramuricea clavata]